MDKLHIIFTIEAGREKRGRWHQLEVEKYFKTNKEVLDVFKKFKSYCKRNKLGEINEIGSNW